MFDIHMEPTFQAEAKILVIGTGDAGCRALNHLINEGLTQVSYLAVNSDSFGLETCLAQKKILLGAKHTRGLGCGSDTTVARKAFKENSADFNHLFSDYDMVFILTGLGGGTGTVVAPIIADEAKRQGALTVTIASLPFVFEGEVRQKQAEEGLSDLHAVGDSVIVVENQEAFDVANAQLPIGQTFALLNERFLQTVRGITSLVTQRRYGRGVQEITRVDFNDIKTIMQDRCRSLIGFGTSNSAEDCGLRAVEAALSEVVRGSHTISGAEGLLVSFTSSPDISIFDVEVAVQRIRDEIGNEVETNVIYGVTTDEAMDHSVEIMVIATGVENPYMERAVEVAIDPIAPVQVSLASKDSDYTVYTNRFWQDPAAEPAYFRKQENQKSQESERHSSTTSHLDWMITPTGNSRPNIS